VSKGMGLAWQSALGIAAVVGCLALTLFWTAGTLAFRQAWVYLSVFFACCIAITAYLAKCDRGLLSRRIASGPAAEVRRSQKVIQTLASVFVFVPYVVAGLDRRFGWSDVPVLASLLAEAFVVLGFLIIYLTFRENTYAGATVRVVEGQTVVDSGPYALVRHPMYAGVIVMMLATPPALGSWVAMASIVPVIAVLAARLIDEEKLLSASLSGYAEYRRRVRWRLLPFVW